MGTFLMLVKKKNHYGRENKVGGEGKGHPERQKNGQLASVHRKNNPLLLAGRRMGVRKLTSATESWTLSVRLVRTPVRREEPVQQSRQQR